MKCLSGSILESKDIHAIFIKKGKKMFKKDKKGKNTWKFRKKCTKFENFLKQGWWLCEIIARNKLAEMALFI